MNCKTSLLLLPLFSALIAAVPVSAAPADKKADPAVLTAQEKAKADAKLRNELWSKMNSLRNEANKFAGERDWDKVHALVKQAPPLFEQIQKLQAMSKQEMERFSWVFQVFQPDRKTNKDQLRGYYEAMIPKAAGDVKADWITNCASFLNEQKMDTSEAIAKFRNTRYDVKDLTPMKRFAFLMEDDRLEDADKLVRQTIAAQPDVKQKIQILNQAIGAFSGKKVFGSVFAGAYYQELLKLTTDPDEKSALLSRWANYAELMALLPDSEIQKLRDSRLTLPGVSDKAKVEAYASDISRSFDDAEIIILRDKALAVAGKNPDLHFRIVKLLSSKTYPPSLKLDCRTFDWYPDFFRKEMAEDPGYTRQQIHELMNNYVRNFSYGKYASIEKELLAYVAKNRRVYAEKIKRWTDYSSRRDAVKKSGDNAKFAELDKNYRTERNAITDAQERYLNALHTLSEFYHANSVRYYDEPDPVMIRKEIDVIRQKIAFCMICSEYDDWFIVKVADQTFRIAELAFSIRDYALVRQCAAENESLKTVLSDYERKRGKKNLLWAITNAETRYQYLLGFIVFEEENYAEAIRILEPLVKPGVRHYGIQRNNVPRTNIYDRLIRSYAALEDYEGALKYADQFLETSAWYMKANKRIQPQIEALRERAAEAKKK